MIRKKLSEEILEKLNAKYKVKLSFKSLTQN
jgi:hypothetical protein